MKTVFAAFIPVLIGVMTYVPLKNGISFSAEKTIVVNASVPLQGTHWKLVELSGKIIPVNATSKEMYLELKSDSTVSGNGGCNAFSGHYSLGKDNQIGFGEMVRTNVLCAGVDYEKNYLDALAKADHYAINGDTLTLKNELVNLAKFTAAK